MRGTVRPNGGVSTRPSGWKRRAPAGLSGRNRRIQAKPSSGRRPKAGPRCHAGPSGERATYGWKRTRARPWAFGRKCIEWGAFSNSLRSSMGRNPGLVRFRFGFLSVQLSHGLPVFRANPLRWKPVGDRPCPAGHVCLMVKAFP